MEYDEKTSLEIRQEARVVKIILDRKSAQIVGWLYEWNTGEKAPMWKDGEHEDISYEPYREQS